MVQYAGKLVLAPMVRAGELPTRLLALRHGADLVWSPEIIDKKLIQCQRRVNGALSTVDFVIPSNREGADPSIVFRTVPELEHGKLIFQIGTSTPSLAVEAALKVIRDVDGIDVNAGCPKHFSVHSGMGAALLQTPDKLCSILVELVEKVGKVYGKPISVKIRILNDEEKTLDLVEKLCATGITNLTVHCRTTPMRNREAPIREYIPKIHEICERSNVSLIMNGAVEDKKHFMLLRKSLNLPETVGGMMADCAEKNPTVFSDSPLPWFKAVKEYLDIARKYDNHTANVKYMMTRMTPGKSPFYQFFTQCRKLSDFAYVCDQLDSQGNSLINPLPYLAEEHEREKAEKKKLNIAKSQKKADLKRAAAAAPNEKNKKVKSG
ncbi:unnamed protein product [Kluyveromyces dobzhanskii CBS 2104]|uniref:tRNA-dihydrouridine(20) synthase [NAD(P)+] n=1 Tax=Kluyveromyces dobzhanskii CBS 2104 TaxID=1427455 RepID=A0A0A8L951_9SACH|nr:unnamed protein product [Kluyveromyces dobzhanskii CBS 2104]